MSERTGSRIFYPYKVVGLICGKQRIRPNYLGTEVFLTVPIGKSFHVYSAQKLQNIMSSTQLTEDINVVEVSREYTFTAVGKDILKWKRFSLVGTMKGEFGTIVTLLRIADYLISTSDDGYLCVWNWTTMELIRTINLGRDFHPSYVMHPNTYMNKVLVGSATGKLQLWNIRTGSLIMDFKGYSSGISFMEQAPTVDIIAIGLSNGEIDVLNLKYDKSVMHFQQASCVTSLSFFSNMTKAPLLLSSGTDGHICLWNVKERRLHFENETAHEGIIHSAFFLPDSMRFISAGIDNSMKLWTIDEMDYSPRVVLSRQGHTDSSAMIRFYGYNSVISRDDGGDGLGMSLLSAGLDGAFRDFHIMKENTSRELSQGSDAKKAKSSRPENAYKRLPVIIDFAYSEGRDRAWSNIVTCHEHSCVAIGWKFSDHVKTNLQLALPEEVRELENYALCCDVSNNGETAAIGYRDGSIAIYNLQSGLFRGSLPREAKKGFVVKKALLGYLSSGSQQEGKGHHTDRVLSIGIDITNTRVISISADQSIHIWDLIERVLIHSISLPSLPCQAIFSRSTGLIAVACVDHSVRVYDSQTYGLIRRFEMEQDITSMTMNEAGRWLFVADASGDVRVFDVPNSRMIDWLHFKKPVLSLTISTNDEFIATSHQQQIGIQIWANNCFYSDILLTTIPSSPCLMDEEKIQSNDIPSEVKPIQTIPTGMEVCLPSRVAGGTMTLTHSPRSKWSSLPILEQIRERNKPEEPPKAPEKAPFFLPTASGLQPSFVATPTDENQTDGEELKSGMEEEFGTSRFVSQGDVTRLETDLQRLLHECAETEAETASNVTEIEDEEDIRITLGSFYPLLLHFRHATVASVDAQLRMLCIGSMDSIGKDALRRLFAFFRVAVKAQVDYEMIQALLERTLQLYSDVVSEMSDILPLLKEISMDQEESWKRVQSMMQQCLCMVELFSNVQL